VREGGIEGWNHSIVREESKNEIGECVVRLSATSNWIGGKLGASHWWSKGQPISQTLIKGNQVKGVLFCLCMSNIWFRAILDNWGVFRWCFRWIVSDF